MDGLYPAVSMYADRFPLRAFQTNRDFSRPPLMPVGTMNMRRLCDDGVGSVW